MKKKYINRELFERSFQRPKDYPRLSPERQWEIDKELGLLDWDGVYFTVKNKDLLDSEYTEEDEAKVLKFYKWY